MISFQKRCGKWSLKKWSGSGNLSSLVQFVFDDEDDDYDADGDDDDDGDCGGGGRREGWVTVMLMQFVPLPPTVHQEYTNDWVKMTNRMKYLMAGWN